MASNDINIPIEIVIDILVRLPVKSIFRFKCVCKTWHVLIQSHEFDKLHFINRSLKNKSYNCSLILPVKRKIMVNGVQPAVVSCLYRAYLDPNQTRLDLSEVALPPSFRPSLENISSNDHDLYHTIYGDAVNNKHLVYGNFEVVGSCNGLVLNLLIVSRIGHFAICNPAIENEHAFKILPGINFRDYFPSFYEHREEFRVLYGREGQGFYPLRRIRYGVFGFGYDSVSSLYMIVYFTPYTALVFSLAKDGRGSWRSIDVPQDVLNGPEPEFERVLMEAYGHGVSTNNHLHWRITEFDYEVYEYSREGILSFDIGNEKWGRVPVLDELAIKSYIIEIGVLDGCLCLLNSRRSNYFSLDLWIMKEYGVKESWTKLFKVPNGSGIPLFHQKGRYKFLLPGTEEGLGWFNPTDNKIRKIEFHGCEFSGQNYYSDTAKLCFESFVDPFSSIK